jgi:hypothetical protein
MRFTYTAGGQEGWGGVMWWPHGCTWPLANAGLGGIDIPEGAQIAYVFQLSFWARGDQGGERIEFSVGSDAGGLPPTPKRSLGSVWLASYWRQYEISLVGIDLSDAISLFYWGANDAGNPDGAVFYIEDIQFEGSRPWWMSPPAD